MALKFQSPDLLDLHVIDNKFHNIYQKQFLFSSSRVPVTSWATALEGQLTVILDGERAFHTLHHLHTDMGIMKRIPGFQSLNIGQLHQFWQIMDLFLGISSSSSWRRFGIHPIVEGGCSCLLWSIYVAKLCIEAFYVANVAAGVSVTPGSYETWTIMASSTEQRYASRRSALEVHNCFFDAF